MNFLSLEYFVKVAECGSIRKAAAELFITEQALSSSVKKLEAELEVELLRRSRPMTLTKAGEIFAENAKEILKKREQMLEELHPYRNSASFTVGVINDGAPAFLTDLIFTYEQSGLKAQWNIESGRENDILHNPKIHLIFMPCHIKSDFRQELLYEDRVCVVVTKKLLEKVYPGECETLMEQFKEANHIHLLKKLPFLNATDRLWNEVNNLDFQPIAVKNIPKQVVNFDFCRKGFGALLYPLDDIKRIKLGMRKEDAEEILVFPLADSGMPFFLNIQKNVELSVAEKEFVQFCRDYFENWRKDSSTI